MAGKPGAVKTLWQDWEINALKAAWPKGGLAAAQAALPQRSKNSIKGKARALRLRVAGRMPHRRQESSEWIDAAIKRAYRQPKPELKRLARELDREVGWLKWRAGVLGVRRVAEQPWRRWTEAEIDLLRDGIERGYALSTLHRRLRQAGFQRSLSAVADRVGELLQNIGVKQTEFGYRLVFGAHRLEAVKALGWSEIQARIFPEDTSDDECLLAELQENRIRNDLTGAERKAFAAEVGRLSQKLQGQSNQVDQSNFDQRWLIDLADKSGLTKQTAYNWWSAFCKETGLTLTPKQASDENRQVFFAWLDAQKQADEAEKARKQAEAEAEKKRKEQEAKARRMETERRDFLEYLDAIVKEWGAEVVKQWIKEWLR